MRLALHTLVLIVAIIAIVTPLAAAAEVRATDYQYGVCNDVLPEPRIVRERAVGPESCLLLEAEVEFDEREYVRIDMGLDGTAEGYVTMDGTYHEYLTNSPDLIFEQAGTPGERFLAIARYERLRGSAILLMLPKSVEDWNGKLWVSAHGRGRSFRNGRLQIWNRYFDPENPVASFDKIDRVLLNKGYAVAVTNRTSEQDIGEVIAELEDGTIIDFAAFNDNASLIKDFTLVAENMIEARLGRKPERTYLYGHSAGARIARSINYTPGLNEDAAGEPVFDGYLMDDSATGLWLPVIMRDGRDVLFDDEEERETFQPQVELVHQMYTKVWSRAPDRATFTTPAYLVNKRLNAQILRDKGFGDRFRMYEIRSMSHLGGEDFPPDNRAGKALVLDISLIVGGAVDVLDALADGNANVPPTKSDWHDLADVDADGIIDYPAIAYPEVACPLGLFYPFPQAGGYLTAYAAYKGDGLEPLDEAGVFVDMNRNGVWDLRETPTQAWQRLGLIEQGEQLTHRRYVECVEQAAGSLVEDGFFTQETAMRYIDEARVRSIDPADLVE